MPLRSRSHSCHTVARAVLVALLTVAVSTVFSVAAPATATAAQPTTPPAVAASPRVSTSLPAHGAASGPAMPCARSVRACMSLSRGQAWLGDGAGHITYGPVPAHGGSRRAATPVGTFHVLSKNAHYYSREFHAPMPDAVFFYPGDAFHADNPALASSGCIHLSTGAAQRFYQTLHIGDQVQVVR